MQVKIWRPSLFSDCGIPNQLEHTPAALDQGIESRLCFAFWLSKMRTFEWTSGQMFTLIWNESAKISRNLPSLLVSPYPLCMVQRISCGGATCWAHPTDVQGCPILSDAHVRTRVPRFSSFFEIGWMEKKWKCMSSIEFWSVQSSWWEGKITVCEGGKCESAFWSGWCSKPYKYNIRPVSDNLLSYVICLHGLLKFIYMACWSNLTGSCLHKILLPHVGYI